MTLLTAIVVLACHVPVAYPFFRKLHRGVMPSVVDFATFGVVVYYDLGIVAEILVARGAVEHFPRLAEARDCDFVISLLLIVFAPWAVRIGARLLHRGSRPASDELGELSKSGRVLFFFAAVGSSVVMGWLGSRSLLRHEHLWVARAAIAEEFGPMILVLSIPKMLLVFYVRLRNARTWSGILLVAILVTGATLAILPLGQRTPLLITPLIVVLFMMRVSLRRIALVGVAGVVLAAAALPLFKWQAAEEERGILDSVAYTVISDFHRANVLGYTVQNSPAFGSGLLPYPGAGYVYATLLFVPRPLAPFKGHGTATYITAARVGGDPASLTWGFGTGLLEELVANFGWLVAFPGMVAWGVLFDLVQRFSDRYPTALVPTRLGAIWIMGYNLPTTLAGYGVMAAFAVVAWKILGRPSLSRRAGREAAASSFGATLPSPP